MQTDTGIRRSGVARHLAVAVLMALGCSTASAGAAEFSWNDFLGPFHNVVLHYPVGFITMVCILEVYGWKSASDELRRIIGLTLWLAIASTVAAAALGFARAADGGYNEQTLDAHKIYGIAVIVLSVAAALVSGTALKEGASSAVRWGYRMLLLCTFTAMSVTGHKGGDLTHGSGYLTRHAPSVLRELLGEEVKAEEKAEAESQPTSAKPSLFASVVWPALEAKCVKCHGGEKHKGDYRLDTREFALTPGDSEEKPIVPGKPAESYLMTLIMMSEDDDDVMPPSGKEPLTAEEKEAIRQWITEGASYSLTAE